MQTELEPFLGKIHHGDCIECLGKVPSNSVDLVFADPPFNIGYQYDVYEDQLEDSKYLNWSAEWMKEVHRILDRKGAFWLAIGDEYAAELKVEAKKIGFHMRNWVVWYYTFGVHCHSKFTRSHVHLFYFLKHPKEFTFHFPQVAVPSARQLVYNDKRANPEGRSPDDTWILRPQDCIDGFQADEDTWYLPRVAGTFKERAGFHGCQMPEQLLGRIIEACTNVGDVVVDPFSGSATTLTVAKKLGRKFFGFELSKDYVDRGTQRIKNAVENDQLEGAEQPRASAPGTYAHLTKTRLQEPTLIETELNREATGLVEAFVNTHRGFSVDRIIADPILNEDFQTHCERLSIPGSESDRNRFLFRMRKSGRLKRAGVLTTVRTDLGWQQIDEFLHASEIAWNRISHLYSASLDDIFCDPRIAREFDRIASQFMPGRSSLEYRWSALKLRKETGVRRKNLRNVAPAVESLLKQKKISFKNFDIEKIRQAAGVYAVKSESELSKYLYIGETHDLNKRLAGLVSAAGVAPWYDYGKLDLQLQFLPVPITTRLTNQLTLLQKTQGSHWNCKALTMSK